MSNLWFFRLKRAEQQRRRSSGEQSTGSASVHSLSSSNSRLVEGCSTTELGEEEILCNEVELKVTGCDVVPNTSTEITEHAKRHSFSSRSCGTEPGQEACSSIIDRKPSVKLRDPKLRRESYHHREHGIGSSLAQKRLELKLQWLEQQQQNRQSRARSNSSNQLGFVQCYEHEHEHEQQQQQQQQQQRQQRQELRAGDLRKSLTDDESEKSAKNKDKLDRDCGRSRMSQDLPCSDRRGKFSLSSELTEGQLATRYRDDEKSRVRQEAYKGTTGALANNETRQVTTTTAPTISDSVYDKGNDNQAKGTIKQAHKGKISYGTTSTTTTTTNTVVTKSNYDSDNQAKARASFILPQVTIIRSDSTSSFIPMSPTSDGQPSSLPGTTTASTTSTTPTPTIAAWTSASVCSNSHQNQSKNKQLISRIAKSNGINPSNRVESLCMENDNNHNSDNNNNSNSNIINIQKRDEQHKLQQACYVMDRSIVYDENGLRAQLNSGQVPPIRERKNIQHLSSGGNRTHLDPNDENQGAQLGSNFADSLDNLASLIPRVRVEFYNSGNTLKERLQMYLIKDHTLNLYVRSFKLILKVLACYLYILRVMFDRGPSYAYCFGCQPNIQANGTQQQQQQQPQDSIVSPQSLSKFDSPIYDGPINFKALFWVDRGPIIWSLQAFIAVLCFLEAILMQYLTYKNSVFSIISFHFILELVTTTPFIVSVFWRQLRTLFVPGFLNCWLAKQCLEAMLNDLSIVRQSSVFSHRLTILSATVFCLIFTSACGFQHTQRSGGRNYITIFESIYFVVVTFSTVGYGDFKPETWPSQLFIMVMICVALIVLPTQFEQLAYFWIERKKLGASYAHHSTRHEKHVVVCSTTLRADTIMDFLNEFYAHPLLQTFSVVLLSPCDLDTTMKLVLQTPTWNNRVVYIQGSALRANDLIRARMQSAEACFILAARNYSDRSAADQHTILRSWAIRDFSPYVPQYVQIFRTENKIHVAFAEHVVCDDEFKYALLANNCLIPGTSTLVTLLLHTTSQQQQQHQRRQRARHKKRKRGRRMPGFSSLFGLFRSARPDDNRLRLDSNIEAKLGSPLKGNFDDSSSSNERKAMQQNYSTVDDEDYDDDDDNDDEDDREPAWKRLYGKCSANEIYHIRLADSRFFGEYQGKSFTYASFHSHRKFGVALIGVQTDMRGTWPIMLNPGPSYVLKASDILFYINVTKEENSALMPMKSQQLLQSPSVMQMTSTCHSLNQQNTPHSPSGSIGHAHEIISGTMNKDDEDNNVNDDHVDDEEGKVDDTKRDDLQPNDEPSDQLSTTQIRIESSSPTNQIVQHDTLINVHEPESAQASRASTVIDMDQTVLAEPTNIGPKKHSIADGASIVARSLCSVAGISAPPEEHNRLLAGLAGALVGNDNDIGGEQSLGVSKRQHRRTKRNSTASTLGISESQGPQGGQTDLTTASSTLNVSSTLELATLASRLRKGSNMSISSSKSRDVSPTRLKQVVNGLVVKMKRVKLGKSLTHLTIPRMDLGGGSSASSTESFVNARGRRPSIAPVPAMMGESEEQDSDHEREQESYFSTCWNSTSECSPIVKKFVFCTTYVGVSPTLCYLLQRKKPACCLQLIMPCEHCPYKNARQYNWPNRCIILASDFASNGIYNFLVPLRAHFHNPSELRPIVLLLETKPTPQFIDAIAWFPMVYWIHGTIDRLDDLIKAGMNLAHSVVVTNKETTNSNEDDYLADCNTIVAVQTMFKMFPSTGIITELSQSSNMRFMQFRAHDLLFGPFSMANLDRALLDASKSSTDIGRQQQSGIQSSDLGDNRSQTGSGGGPNMDQQQMSAASRAIRDRIQLRRLHSQLYNKQLGKEHAYKYRLPFAAGNVFSASMLDTLLYQAFVKDYMITMVRLLLGIDQAPGSGFLSSMRITKEDLWIRTYGRLYQRLCSTSCEIPLGIYRTEPLESKRIHSDIGNSASFGAFMSQQASYEHATEELERIEITNMVRNRLEDLGMLVSDYDDSPPNRNNTFSYVIINPNCDISLKEGDIIYLIRPSPIHSRKLFINRANSFRYPTTGANSGAGPDIGQKRQHQARSQRRDEPETNDGQQHQQSQTSKQQAPSGCIKSCLSDGDFNEILIKVNDQDQRGQAVNINQNERILSPIMTQSDSRENLRGQFQNRRRSSCSDVDEQQASWRD